MKLINLIEQSGDCNIENLNVNWKEVTFKVELYDSEEIYFVKFSTSSIHFAGGSLNGNKKANFSRLEMIKLVDKLQLENNKFIPVFSFKDIMINRREGSFLGHGAIVDESFVISVIGEEGILYCHVLNENDVVIASNRTNSR